jgi:hypothetical protein
MYKSQYVAYAAYCLLLNVGLLWIGTAVPYVGLFIIAPPHVRDCLGVLYRWAFRPSVAVDPDGGFYQSHRRVVVCAIMAYNETNLRRTILSLGEQHEEGLLCVSVIIISSNDVRGPGFVGGMPILVVPPTNKEVIMKLYRSVHPDFIFHTAGGTVIEKGALRRMSNIMMANKSIAAVTGMVRFEGGSPWDLLQGFSHAYRQVVRTRVESTWGKVTCLAGAVTMVSANHPAVVRAERRLPRSSSFFRAKGADRRYTNCISQRNKGAFLVLDTGSVAYKKTYRHPLKRHWNSITGHWDNLYAPKTLLKTRLCAAVDLFCAHTHTVRLAITIQFVVNVTAPQAIAVAVVVLVPVAAFLAHELKWRFFPPLINFGNAHPDVNLIQNEMEVGIRIPPRHGHEFSE